MFNKWFGYCSRSHHAYCCTGCELGTKNVQKSFRLQDSFLAKFSMGKPAASEIFFWTRRFYQASERSPPCPQMFTIIRDRSSHAHLSCRRFGAPAVRITALLVTLRSFGDIRKLPVVDRLLLECALLLFRIPSDVMM